MMLCCPWCISILFEWRDVVVQQRKSGWSVDARESRELVFVCYSSNALMVKNEVTDQRWIVGLCIEWKYIAEFRYRLNALFSTDGWKEAIGVNQSVHSEEVIESRGRKLRWR